MSCSEWQTVKLGDVADVLSGYAFKTKDFIEKGIPVVKIKNIIPPIIDISDTQYVSMDLYNEKSKFALEYDDILISLTGSNVNQLASAVGKIGRVKLKNTKLLLNQRVGKLYITEEKLCNYDYLYYYLIQPEVRYNLASSAGGSANQANISPTQIKDIEIKLPPLEVQEKIAKILSSLDDKIELNNEMNKTLEEMAQSIFKRWFVDFEFPNEDGQPYKSSGGEMVESELGMIPRGWEVKEIGETELIIEDGDRGKNYPNKSQLLKEGYCPFLNNKNIINDKVNFNSCDFISEERDKLLRKGKININDIILTTRGSVGNIGILHEYLNYNFARINSGMVIIKNNSYLDLMYLYCLMKSDYMKLQYKNMTTGTAQPQLPIKDINKIKILVPDKNIQMKCGNILKLLYDKIFQNDNEIDILSKKRDILLPKLMSGEIKIK